MFCNKCGQQMPDNTVFCGGCGTNNQGGGQAAQQPIYKVPSFEFKTVRCYPSDYEENKYKEFYEDCGWTIMDMDRKQTNSGGYSAGGYNVTNYSTTTHIKMQRDKNHPHYAKIKELSETAEAYFDTTPAAKKYGNKTKAAFLMFLLLGLMLLPYGIGCAFLFESLITGIIMGSIGGVFIFIAIIIRTKTAKKIRLKKKELQESYNRNKAVANQARVECKKLVEDI